MGWFGFIVTQALFLAVAAAVVYVIFNIIYHIADTAKGCAVISFIVNLIMLSALFTMKQGPNYEFGKGYQAGTTGFIVMAGIAFVFATCTLFVNSNMGDDLGAGIGEAAGSAITLMSVAATILCFAKTWWPLYIIVIIALLVSVVVWLQAD